MTSTDTVVVGAGHAGLAVSRLLTETARDHVVLERGRVAERWHSQRWDSLRLLTPNWMTRLPGWSYSGGDPDGFQTAAEFATSLRSYAHGFDAPVLDRTAVGAIRPRGDGYAVTTTSGIWRARNVVLATGHCDIARIPPALDRLDPDVRVVSSADYATRRSCPRAASSSWGRPRPGCRSPTNWRAAAGGSCSLSAPIPGCRAATAAGT